MSKRQRDSGGGDDDSFDPMAFYREQQQAMLSQAARLGRMRSLELSKSKMRSQAELMTGFSLN